MTFIQFTSFSQALSPLCMSSNSNLSEINLCYKRRNHSFSGLFYCDELSGIFTKWHFSRLCLFGAVSHCEVECSECGERRSSGYVRTDQAVHCTLGVRLTRLVNKHRKKKCSCVLGGLHLYNKHCELNTSCTKALLWMEDMINVQLQLFFYLSTFQTL